MLRPHSLVSAGGSTLLGEATGIQLGLKSQGFGWPSFGAQFSEGAAGRRYRGTRIGPRKLPLVFKLTGEDHTAVRARLSTVASIIDPSNGLVRFTVEIDGELWWVDMTVTADGDWSWDSDTDGESELMVPLTFETEHGYWTRTDQESAVFIPGNVSDGLLGSAGSLVGMELSSVTSLGEVALTNPGDAEAPMLAKIEAPFSGFTLIGAGGEEVSWTYLEQFGIVGSKAAGYILVDMGEGTVVDETGANYYAGLNAVPVFWTLKRGTSDVELSLAGASVASKITVFYYPRRWVMF